MTNQASPLDDAIPRRLAGALCDAESVDVLAVRDASSLDDDRDRARLAGRFGHMTARQRNLGASVSLQRGNVIDEIALVFHPFAAVTALRASRR